MAEHTAIGKATKTSKVIIIIEIRVVGATAIGLSDFAGEASSCYQRFGRFSSSRSSAGIGGALFNK